MGKISVPGLDKLLEAMLCANPLERYSAEECLRSPWLQPLMPPDSSEEDQDITSSDMGGCGDYYWREETKRGLTFDTKCPLDGGALEWDMYGKEFELMAMQQELSGVASTEDASPAKAKKSAASPKADELPAPPAPLPLSLCKREHTEKKAEENEKEKKAEKKAEEKETEKEAEKKAEEKEKEHDAAVSKELSTSSTKDISKGKMAAGSAVLWMRSSKK